MRRSMIPVLLAACAISAFAPALAEPVREGAAVRINPGGSMEPMPAQPDKAFRPAERDKAMGKNPSNGCDCESSNRCSHSLDFNFCIDRNGNRVYLQRFWGQ